MVQSKLMDSASSTGTGDFARFVAEEQKAEALTLKQQRLYAEETGKKNEKEAK